MTSKILFNLLAIAALSLSSCSQKTSADSAAPATEQQPARSDATETDTPYEDRHGDDDCTQDCSGHEAGYKWAEDNDITDESDCTGNSDSFIEGCKAYVEDNQ